MIVHQIYHFLGRTIEKHETNLTTVRVHHRYHHQLHQEKVQHLRKHLHHQLHQEEVLPLEDHLLRIEEVQLLERRRLHQEDTEHVEHIGNIHNACY